MSIVIPEYVIRIMISTHSSPMYLIVIQTFKKLFLAKILLRIALNYLKVKKT